MLRFPLQVTGGGLEGGYNFAQLHFHWGTVHTIGSEHTVSEESYPMEVRKRYKTFGDYFWRKPIAAILSVIHNTPLLQSIL